MLLNAGCWIHKRRHYFQKRAYLNETQTFPWHTQRVLRSLLPKHSSPFSFSSGGQSVLWSCRHCEVSSTRCCVPLLGRTTLLKKISSSTRRDYKIKKRPDPFWSWKWIRGLRGVVEVISCVFRCLQKMSLRDGSWEKKKGWLCSTWPFHSGVFTQKYFIFFVFLSSLIFSWRNGEFKKDESIGVWPVWQLPYQVFHFYFAFLNF